MAAIQLQLNGRPPVIGLPGSGGVPSDHIGFNYALGADTYILKHIGRTFEVRTLH